jgi:acyl-CoA thioester hydrolase
VRPATYGQRIDVRTELLEFENRLKIGYEIVDCATGTRLTKGTTIQVAIEASTQETQFVSPPVVFEKLERAWAR